MVNHRCLDLKEDEEDALERCLKKLDLDRLLGALLVFIEFYIKDLPHNEVEEHM